MKPLFFLPTFILHSGYAGKRCPEILYPAEQAVENAESGV
jgi:hypothetical protein